MKMLIQVLYTHDWSELADIVIPNLNIYAGKHGYDTSIIKYKEVFSGYEKLVHIRNIIDAYDAIWSLDLDTLITNHNIKIEDFLDDEHDAYFTKDYNGLNCGSFIIKKSPFSDMLLDTALAAKGLPKMYCEQDALNAVLEFSSKNILDNIKFLPQGAINAYRYSLYPDIPPQTHEQGNWEEGDFVLHLPGLDLPQRIEILKNTKIIL